MYSFKIGGRLFSVGYHFTKKLSFFVSVKSDPSDPDAVLIKRIIGVAGDYVK